MINYRGLVVSHASLGAHVTTDNLFDPNEQVIFDFYEASRDRYRRAADVGACIGVHSVLMARQGWEVHAYEPDPNHFAVLLRVVDANLGRSAVLECTQAAVSDRDGVAAFVRVLGNTTASHLSGARDFHGPIERSVVNVVDCRRIFDWADFVKIDCEGHEAALLCCTTAETWEGLDVLLEVGSAEAARKIYEHLDPLVFMWAQKIGWRQVSRLEDVPAHHSEGSLFVGRRPPAV